MNSRELQNALSVICEKIACGNYEEAKAIFELTPCEPPDDPQNLLVEALGMMLLRVEAREFELERLISEINNARASLKQNHLQLTREIRRLRKRLHTRTLSVRPVAQSPVMQRAILQAEQNANTGIPLLILGEQGTGKNQLARHVHGLGQRNGLPLLCTNVALLPPLSVDQELFGNVDNILEHKGLIEKAAGGTLVLNGVTALPLSAQKKLLAYFETGLVRRTREPSSRAVDVRIIATSRKDIDSAVNAGHFLPELRDRLGQTEIFLPPLRKRLEDIPVLTKYFLAQQTAQIPHAASTLNGEAMSLLVGHCWPGNVRELENAVRNAALIADDDCIKPENIQEIMGATLVRLPPPPEELHANSGRPEEFEPLPLTEIEAAHIKRVLSLTSGNKSRAAQILGISREGLRTKLQRLSSENPGQS